MVANAIAQINCLDFKQIILNRMKWSNEPTDLYIALSRFNIPKLEIFDNNFENLNLTLLSKTLVQIRELRIGLWHGIRYSTRIFQTIGNTRSPL